MNEADMEDRDSGSDTAWEKERGRLFRPVVPPTRAETEAFVQRLMERLPEERAPWAGRWLFPSVAFSAAALALSLVLPAAEEDTSDALGLTGTQVVSAWAKAPPSAEDLVGFSLEDK